jgi:hypothetical protein
LLKLPQTHSIEQSPQEIPINLFNRTIPTRNPHKPIQSNNHLKKSPKKKIINQTIPKRNPHKPIQSNNPLKKFPQKKIINQTITSRNPHKRK